MRLGNRRRKRNEYLLDVKVHAEGRLRRRLQSLLLVAVGAALLAGSGYGMYRLGGWALNRLLYENRRFTLRQISVETDGVLTAAEVLRVAGVAAGVNLLRVDLETVRRNLESLPLVRRVEVQRQLPDRLMIRVAERVAVAQVVGSSTDPSVRYYLDREGWVMQPVKLGERQVVPAMAGRQLPVLVGVRLEDLRVGRRSSSEAVHRALELLARLEQSVASSLVEVQQIDVSRPRHLTVVTRQNTVVRFDVENFAQQWRRLSAILVWAQQRQRAVQSVDLTVQRGVPVTLGS